MFSESSRDPYPYYPCYPYRRGRCNGRQWAVCPMKKSPSVLESVAGEGEIPNPSETVADTHPPENSKRGRGRPRNPPVYLEAARVGKLSTLDDVIYEIGKVYRATRRGQIPTADAAKLSYVLSTLKQAIEARDARLVALPAPADTRVFPDLQDFYATVNFVDPPATDDDEKPSDVVPS